MKKAILIMIAAVGEGEIRCFGSGNKIADLGGSYDFDNEASSSKIPQQSKPCF